MPLVKILKKREEAEANQQAYWENSDFRWKSKSLEIKHSIEYIQIDKMCVLNIRLCDEL